MMVQGCLDDGSPLANDGKEWYMVKGWTLVKTGRNHGYWLINHFGDYRQYLDNQYSSSLIIYIEML